jgi:hypothetical protein
MLGKLVVFFCCENSKYPNNTIIFSTEKYSEKFACDNNLKQIVF